jgi:hypothetical protein
LTNAASESWCVGGDVIVDSIWVSATTLSLAIVCLCLVYSCPRPVCSVRLPCAFEHTSITDWQLLHYIVS